VKILSIDFATKKTGYAIFINGKLQSYGIMYADSQNVHERILHIRSQILEKIIQYGITHVVLEEIPMQKNNNLIVAHDLCVGQGAILVSCYDHNLGLKLYSPTSWRSIMELYNGTNESKKRDYQKQAAVNLVNELYGLDLKYYKSETKKNKTDDDIAEAILIGLAFIKEESNG